MKKIIFLLLTVLSFSASAQKVLMVTADRSVPLDTLKTYTAIFLKPTAADKNVTFPGYTPATGTRIVYISNISTVYRLVVNGRDTISPGRMIVYQWASSLWSPAIPDMSKYYAIWKDTLKGPMYVNANTPIYNWQDPNNYLQLGVSSVDLHAASEIFVQSAQTVYNIGSSVHSYTFTDTTQTGVFAGSNNPLAANGSGTYFFGPGGFTISSTDSSKAMIGTFNGTGEAGKHIDITRDSVFIGGDDNSQLMSITESLTKIGTTSGAAYADDYSGSYTDRSLVDKGFVDDTFLPLVGAQLPGDMNIYTGNNTFYMRTGTPAQETPGAELIFNNGGANINFLPGNGAIPQIGVSESTAFIQYADLITPANSTSIVTASGQITASGDIEMDTAVCDKLTVKNLTDGLVKSVSDVLTPAVAGTDYAPATSGTSILKGNGAGGFSNASAGTDYLSMLTGAITSSGNTTSLGSFTSANLSGALTNETGGGLAVFNNTPALITPDIGAATGTSLALTGTFVNLTAGGATSIGNTDAFTLGLKTNGANRMTISGGGLFTFANASTSSSTTLATFTQAANTGGTTNGLTWTAGAHTSQTTATEIVDINYNLSAVMKMIDGTVPVQRGFLITGRTYTPQTTALTLTVASTLDVTQSTAGAGTTITNNFAQRWLFNSTNYGGINVNSTGSLSVTATGTGASILFPSNAVIFGNTLSLSGTVANANFAAISNANTTNALTQAQLNIGGTGTIHSRVWMRGSTNMTPGVGENYASFIVGQQSVTIAASGTHNVFAGTLFRPINITTGGGGTVTTSATVYIDGAASTGATINYSLFIAGGSVAYGTGSQMTLFNGVNIATGTGTGSIIGTTTGSKLGFWAATPIVQPTTSFAAGTLVSNLGTPLTSTDTIDGYTLLQIVRALRSEGLLQ